MIWVENRAMPPATMRNKTTNETNAASNLLNPHPSNLLTRGSKINESNKAMLSGMSTGFAKTNTANRAKMKTNV
jgi:hypothetical protein